MSSPRHARSASTQQSELHRTLHRHPSGDGSAARRCRPMLDEMRASQAESPFLACCPSLFLGIPAHALVQVRPVRTLGQLRLLKSARTVTDPDTPIILYTPFTGPRPPRRSVRTPQEIKALIRAGGSAFADP